MDIVGGDGYHSHLIFPRALPPPPSPYSSESSLYPLPSRHNRPRASPPRSPHSREQSRTPVDPAPSILRLITTARPTDPCGRDPHPQRTSPVEVETPSCLSDTPALETPDTPRHRRRLPVRHRCSKEA